MGGLSYDHNAMKSGQDLLETKETTTHISKSSFGPAVIVTGQFKPVGVVNTRLRQISTVTAIYISKESITTNVLWAANLKCSQIKILIMLVLITS